jgi:hypothetical protein
MSKKIMLMAAGMMAFGLIAAANSSAQAQSASSSASATVTTSMTSTVADSSTATSSTTFSTGSTTSLTEAGSGYLQLDDLVVTAVASSSMPTQIYAANPVYPTMPMTPTMMATSTSDVMAPTAASITCESFVTDSATIGTYVGCPTPAIAPTLMTTNASSTGNASSSSSTYYSPYTLQIDSTTQLLLSGRAPAVLANFAPGDIINVYGYYNSSDGIMAAEIVRDLSKPASMTVPSVSEVTTVEGTTSGVTSSSATATLQADLSQLETLVTQLQAQVTGTATSSASVTM